MLRKSLKEKKKTMTPGNPFKDCSGIKKSCVLLTKKKNRNM